MYEIQLSVFIFLVWTDTTWLTCGTVWTETHSLDHKWTICKDSSHVCRYKILICVFFSLLAGSWWCLTQTTSTVAVEFGDASRLLGDFKAPWVSNVTVAIQCCVILYIPAAELVVLGAKNTMVWLKWLHMLSRCTLYRYCKLLGLKAKVTLDKTNNS